MQQPNAIAHPRRCYAAMNPDNPTTGVGCSALLGRLANMAYAYSKLFGLATTKRPQDTPIFANDISVPLFYSFMLTRP